MSASSCGKVGAVKLLLDKGADANLINSEFQIALHLHKGRLDIVKLLLPFTKDIDYQDYYGNTALHKAAIFNSIDVAEYLLSNDCNINIVNSEGNTSLHIACDMNNKLMVIYLIKNFASREIRNNYGKKPLELLSINTYREVIRQI